MKRLVVFLIIVILGIIAFFQYDKYKRFHPPVDYEYVVNDGIDINYHDPAKVIEYYRSAREVGSHARYAWKKHKVDMRVASPEDAEEGVLLQEYNHLIAQTRFLEKRLLASAEMKAKGYSNDDVRIMEERNFSELDLKVWKILRDDPVLEFKDQSTAVYEVQKMLVKKGYEIQVDGYFNTETREAVKKFQQDNEILPSGRVGDITMKALLQ